MFFLSDLLNKKLTLPKPGQALAGRTTSIQTAASHHVSGGRSRVRFRTARRSALFGMGCFWGAERLFWRSRRRLGDGGRLLPAAETPNPPIRRPAPG